MKRFIKSLFNQIPIRRTQEFLPMEKADTDQILIDGSLGEGGGQVNSKRI